MYLYITCLHTNTRPLGLDTATAVEGYMPVARPGAFRKTRIPNINVRIPIKGFSYVFWRCAERISCLSIGTCGGDPGRPHGPHLPHPTLLHRDATTTALNITLRLRFLHLNPPLQCVLGRMRTLFLIARCSTPAAGTPGRMTLRPVSLKLRHAFTSKKKENSPCTIQNRLLQKFSKPCSKETPGQPGGVRRISPDSSHFLKLLLQPSVCGVQGRRAEGVILSSTSRLKVSPGETPPPPPPSPLLLLLLRY